MRLLCVEKDSEPEGPLADMQDQVRQRSEAQQAYWDDCVEQGLGMSCGSLQIDLQVVDPGVLRQ
jgi:hypothetical protein